MRNTRLIAPSHQRHPQNYTRELKERKRLFNLVQELRGNIRVFCRARPPTGRACVGWAWPQVD